MYSVKADSNTMTNLCSQPGLLKKTTLTTPAT